MESFFPTPFALGTALAEACADKAEAVAEFDRDRAAEVMLATLKERRIPLSGEDLSDACKAAGIIPHDDRAFGSVIGALSRFGHIQKAGYTPRRKGHGTAGGTLWEAAKTNVCRVAV